MNFFSSLWLEVNEDYKQGQFIGVFGFNQKKLVYGFIAKCVSKDSNVIEISIEYSKVFRGILIN